ncbi:MAG: tryptophan synthase subunit alpha [Chthoniobacterales bacterium]
MSVLTDRFARLRAEKRCGFIPFIVAGDPDLRATAALLLGLSELQPVAIELGIPFSDPTADGPVIQRASQRSLGNATTLTKIMRMLKGMRRAPLAPIVLFTYYNPVLQLGVNGFTRAAARCGISGVLAVDLPAEAAEPLHTELRRREIDLIQLIAPTTSDQRLKQIARRASGFLYVVSRTGVTGTAHELEDESRHTVQRVRQVSDLGIAVGFGITNRRQARRVCEYADAAVVGSRLVAEIEAVTAKSDSGVSAVTDAVMRLARQFTPTNGTERRIAHLPYADH